MAFNAFILYIAYNNDHDFAISGVIDVTYDSCPCSHHFDMIEHDEAILDDGNGLPNGCTHVTNIWIWGHNRLANYKGWGK